MPPKGANDAPKPEGAQKLLHPGGARLTREEQGRESPLGEDGELARSASEREDHKRKRYPPADNPHCELVPFVVEARGRLGAEVLPFLRQHAPAEEPLRSAVLARATREISIITKRGLAALLLAAEPRPAAP